jgi:hypothetical protein
MSASGGSTSDAVDIGQGWLEYLDDDSHRPYYMNQVTAEVTWDHPFPLRDDSSLVFNVRTKVNQVHVRSPSVDTQCTEDILEAQGVNLGHAVEVLRGFAPEIEVEQQPSPQLPALTSFIPADVAFPVMSCKVRIFLYRCGLSIAFLWRPSYQFNF